MDRVKAPLDFIGLTHYNRYFVSTESSLPWGIPGSFGGGKEGALTENGWEVWPSDFYDIVMWVTREYGHRSIEITENGACYNDEPDASGKVGDSRRLAFYRGYLTELARAIQDGADVRGYHAWSLMDNFEWAEGYGKRFGLVHVDFKTGRRTIKESGRWYAKVAAANGF